MFLSIIPQSSVDLYEGEAVDQCAEINTEESAEILDSKRPELS